jgi:hypothetical protein
VTDNRCHCKKPAPWMLRIVATKRLKIAEGTPIGTTTLEDHAADTWAACDEHVSEAARTLVGRNDMSKHVLIMRPEFD